MDTGMADNPAAHDKRALGESMRQLLKSKAAAKAQDELPLARGGSEKKGVTYAGDKEFASEEASLTGPARTEAAEWNQAFFDSMEREYEEMCETDGWKEIQDDQDELKKSATEIVVARKSHAPIPAESDYFRAALPAGQDRELRADPSAIVQTAQIPLKVQRNLEELRKVEAATQAAMEKERTKHRAIAEGSSLDGQLVSSAFRPPLRASGDVVALDNLSESDAESDVPQGNTEEEHKVYAALCALQEFDRLGKERQERLAKWRERYGS
mmetsp:Transcript_24747/g.45355  ORF Transcript_24747/g.45355 Transcript_24747/m.45355 type:complete len:269 (-) Transcript_24747:13-819(-)